MVTVIVQHSLTSKKDYIIIPYPQQLFIAPLPHATGIVYLSLSSPLCPRTASQPLAHWSLRDPKPGQVSGWLYIFVLSPWPTPLAAIYLWLTLSVTRLGTLMCSVVLPYCHVTFLDIVHNMYTCSCVLSVSYAFFVAVVLLVLSLHPPQWNDATSSKRW